MPQVLAPTIPPPRVRHTREEYRSLPEGPPYYELIDGEFVDMRRPGRAHTLVAGGLGQVLWPLAARFGGELQGEPNLYLPGVEDVLHPDLLYLAPEHLAASRPDGVHGVPDLVVEILSPTTERKDRTVKIRRYGEAGVPNVWIVSPDSPVLIESYELEPGTGRYRLADTAQAPQVWRHRLFPDSDLPLAVLEPPLRAPGG